MLGSETKTQQILKGLEQSLLRNINYRYLLFGKKNLIASELKKFKKLQGAIEIVDCSESISMEDKPSDIIKSKTHSSMYLAIKQQCIKVHIKPCMKKPHTELLLKLSTKLYMLL